MTPKNMEKICKFLDLGNPVGDPESVPGGLLHVMWFVRTDKAAYAIKQLSKKIDLKNKDIIRNYELTESIAYRFSQQGIPAIAAIEKDGTHLISIGDTGFLAYPWVNAMAIKEGAISEPHALQIAEILSKIHLINLKVLDITEDFVDIYDPSKILELIDRAESHGCSFSADLRRHQSLILSVHDEYQNAISFLNKNTVISHGDLDQKNVLWDKAGKPVLIDWESACKVNPTYDIIKTALYWSGIITDDFSPDVFIKMLHAYQKSGGVIDKKYLEPALSGTFSWLYWMFYNIERAYSRAESPEGRTLGRDQVNQALATIIRLKNVIPKLMTMIINQL